MDLMDALESGQMKRFFSARQKINAPGVMSHITQRASGAELLFREKDDYLEMLARLKKICQIYQVELIAFVLMPNHVHFLLHQNEANLHEAMRDLFSQYARRHNKKYMRNGYETSRFLSLPGQKQSLVLEPVCPQQKKRQVPELDR